MDKTIAWLSFSVRLSGWEWEGEGLEFLFVCFPVGCFDVQPTEERGVAECPLAGWLAVVLQGEEG